MTTQCSSTANSITEVLLAGDAVLNLTQQPLNAITGTHFLTIEGDSFRCVPYPSSVSWHARLASSLKQLAEFDVNRIVVVSDEHSGDAEQVLRELSTRHIAHVHCVLINACDEDAFMDEEDAEAVAERLRQLGYL
jgi:trehalose-6-phosphatase